MVILDKLFEKEIFNYLIGNDGLKVIPIFFLTTSLNLKILIVISLMNLQNTIVLVSILLLWRV